MNKTIEININNYDIPDSADGFLDFWQNQLNQIPEDFRDSAQIEYCCSCYYDGGQLDVALSYQRPETEEEVLERLRKDALWERRQEEDERKQFEMLKKKYGG